MQRREGGRGGGSPSAASFDPKMALVTCQDHMRGKNENYKYFFPRQPTLHVYVEKNVGLYLKGLFIELKVAWECHETQKLSWKVRPIPDRSKLDEFYCYTAIMPKMFYY